MKTNNNQSPMTDDQALNNLMIMLDDNFDEMFNDITESDIEFAQVAAINTTSWDE